MLEGGINEENEMEEWEVKRKCYNRVRPINILFLKINSGQWPRFI